MKRFHFIADAVFDAENIDDAFAKLAEHFKALAEGSDSSLFAAESCIEISPLLALDDDGKVAEVEGNWCEEHKTYRWNCSHEKKP